MDAIFGGKDDSTTTTKEAASGDHHPNPSKSELFSSAKLLAEAAKSSFNRESNDVDKAKTAAAAENLLNAAEEYGDLEKKGYGKYVDKAEEYLHKYHSTPNTGGDPPSEKPKPSEKKPEGRDSGGLGDVTKMAGNFFK